MEVAQREPVVIKFPALTMLKSEQSLIGAHILIAFSALSVGLLMGPFLRYSGGRRL